MRIFLHKLMVDITRHPREIVTPGINFEWDDGNSRIWQVFRVYEYWFGRRSGIKLEGRLYNNRVQFSYTWEHFFAVYEGLIRGWFAGRFPKFSIVYIPQLQLAGQQKRLGRQNRMQMSPFRFAIAFDTSNTPTASTSITYTVTGSNPYLFAGNDFAASSAGITGTYNSVSMTPSAVLTIQGGFFHNVLYLANPSTGSNTLATANNSAGLAASSYSGCANQAPVATNTGTSAGTSFTVTITDSTPGTYWNWTSAVGNNGTVASGTNFTVRCAGNVGAGQAGCGDSNGNVTSGAFSMTVTGFSAQPCGGVAYKFAQVTVATVNSGFFFFALK